MSNRAQDADGVDPRAQVVARALLIGGRTVLMGGIAAVILCRISQPIWISAPEDAGVPDHWITNTTFVVGFLMALTLPLLILPVGSRALTTSDGSTLRVRTVLGPRHVSLASATAYRVTLPGRGTDTALVIIRDARRRIAIVGQSTAWGGPHELDESLAGVLDTPAPTRHGAMRYVLGWVIIVAWSCCSLVVFGTLMALAGAL